ncbi:hypothetical protein NP233_g7780 [Leucocoprinus birnbaumii]|uniref:Uncharacterized protein n=1 Tax=Leucocoprinus birnbaumii TaxID=56174 RepID=A0AAD5YSF8_9AGAR|nr:hypothetical protein NP233_g7780 [Leucocoprinus birnbaumii]
MTRMSSMSTTAGAIYKKDVFALCSDGFSPDEMLSHIGHHALSVGQLEHMAHPALVGRYLSGESTNQASIYYGPNPSSAVAVASLIYDHIRFFDAEISDIWVSLKVSTRIKLVFLLGRYAADAALLYSAYALSGSADSLDLVVSQPEANVLPLLTHRLIGNSENVGALCIATTQGIVIYRLKEVLGRSSAWLEAIPIILFCMGVVMIALELPQFFSTLVYSETSRQCTTTHSLRPVYTIIQFGSLVVSDILVILLFIVAVLETPYTHSSDIMVKLQKDGGWYFLGLFLVHIVNIIVLAWGKMYFPVFLPIGLDKKRASQAPRAYLWHQNRLIRLT